MKVVEIVTKKVIELLEQGTIPWEKGWNTLGTPRNAISKKDYRGFNRFILGLYSFKDPRFLTYKQAKSLKGNVKKGEKGIPIIYWNFTKKDENDIDSKDRAFMRYYTVFNVSQCEELEIKPLETIEKTEIESILEADKVISEYYSKPEIIVGGDDACYVPSLDYVKMPLKEQFKSTVDYYAVLFHEFLHSTGHESRLKRFNTSDIGSMFNKESYSKEELTAELGSAILCQMTGIEKPINNTASYISSWLRALKNDKSMIIKSASYADKAVRFITNVKEETIQD